MLDAEALTEVVLQVKIVASLQRMQVLHRLQLVQGEVRGHRFPAAGAPVAQDGGAGSM
ncbi:hypothetical protein [Rhodococcus koreensis]|uniref:hypothetical protein n=1 Tax=Rhodococcus koreensis TaxID=99653 RepID=UPI001981D953|nr:hypothetical protein [Rhodococcus koreensis]QSE78208.1 hypothetical protein JWS14_03080 [Rhodococcus koreensis]